MMALGVVRFIFYFLLLIFNYFLLFYFLFFYFYFYLLFILAIQVGATGPVITFSLCPGDSAIPDLHSNSH